jgi:putative membrane protein
MIQYDPHRWMDHFFDVRGTLIKEIGTRVGICVAWACLVVAAHLYWRPLGISVIIHSLVGLALGLLLVFRTNASYDRYWEGRKLWGGIVNETRNLVRAASVHLAAAPELLWEVTVWTGVFPWATIRSLRGETDLGQGFESLGERDREEARHSQHLALFVAQRMSSVLKRARDRGHISDIVLVSLDQNVQLLVDYLGGCERIRKTPLPFAYVVHLRRVLVIYCFTLPFALVETFGWFTVLDVLLVAYTYFGIEEIGVEIEGPFGYDENDLPMEEISETIQRNVYALGGVQSAERDEMPSGL